MRRNQTHHSPTAVTLYDDLLCCIFEFVPVKVLYNVCSPVCREWNGLIKKYAQVLEFDTLMAWSSFTSSCDEFDSVRSLSLSMNDFEDVPKVESLDYGKIKLMKNLEILSVNNYVLHRTINNLIGEGFQLVKENIVDCIPQNHSKLVCLTLDGIFLKDQDIQGLANLKNLTYLNIRDNFITNEGVAHISNLTNLTYLDISRNYLRIGSFNYIAKLTKLTILCIRFQNCNIDEGVDTSHEYFSSLENLHTLNISYTGIYDECFQYIYSIPNLKTLNMSHCSITAGLRNISSLTSLDLSNSHITNQQMGSVSKFTNLTNLDLTKCKIGNNGVSFLPRLQKLKSLKLDKCEIVNDDTFHLCKLTNLTQLYLGKCKIESTGMEQLSKLENLTSLVMEDCNLGSLGVKYLSNLTNLQHLELNSCKIGNEGFEKLCSLKNLTSLRLYCSDFKILHKNISKLTNLKQLDLSLCKMGRKELAHLANCAQLTSIILNRCDIGDGLSHLSNLSNLTAISLASCKLTSKDILYLSTKNNWKSINLLSNMIRDEAIPHLEKLEGILKIGKNQFTAKGIERISKLCKFDLSTD